MVSTRSKRAAEADGGNAPANITPAPNATATNSQGNGNRRVTRRKAPAKRDALVDAQPAITNTTSTPDTSVARKGTSKRGRPSQKENTEANAVAKDAVASSSTTPGKSTNARTTSRRLRSNKSADSPLRALEATTRKPQQAMRNGASGKEMSQTPEPQTDADEDPGAGIYFQDSFKIRRLQKSNLLNPPAPLPDELTGDELVEHIEKARRMAHSAFNANHHINGHPDAMPADETARLVPGSASGASRTSNMSTTSSINAGSPNSSTPALRNITNGFGRSSSAAGPSTPPSSSRTPRASTVQSPPQTIGILRSWWSSFPALPFFGTPAPATSTMPTQTSPTPALTSPTTTSPTPIVSSTAPVSDTAETAQSKTSVAPATSPSPVVLPVASGSPQAGCPSGGHQATASPTTPTGREYQDALTMTPTPVGERKSWHKPSRKRPAPVSHRKAIRDMVLDQIPTTQRDRAETWVNDAVARLARDTRSSIGDKRKRLETGILLDDLIEFPSRTPWQNEGSFGLLEGFDDDDDYVPAWYILQQMLDEAEMPAKKKRRTGDYVGKLTDTNVQTSNGTTLIDSHGNSSSLYDYHPRPANSPAPMFEPDFDPSTLSPRREPQPTTATQPKLSFEEELRRNGHVPGSGSFCVPEGSSSEDEGDDDDTSLESDSSTWTQAPPPAPVPAHASLPAQAPEAPATPSAPKGQTVDEVERQRARLNKHTPAVSSRLREVHFPSPSLRSDAGLEPIGGSPERLQTIFTDLPDPMDISWDSEHQALVAIDNFASGKPLANIWEDPVLTPWSNDY
ncbi:hypothetical protein BS50DRAFT_569783 [Corynespora cassiicola Philippines]|uniref:Uncharacterized protein n=1 Tax=Corynespora cassiicola Philippines TaxID=1448308 RepID=A0A2T2P3J2_CORCC|nr:hypothetical protein BS50DRAFT_569783 [Corynespora cassiicola Philippines]